MEDEPVEEIEEESNLPEGESAPASAAEAYVDAVYESSQLNNRRPKYPLKARRKGMEGVVTLQVEVSVLGEPSEISILNSSGYRLLDREARRTVSRWRFHPATQGGQPVTSLVEVPIRFQLKG
ncbi:MAG: energy transducer TonB [Gammaproteobacteria bacterium]|jgi:protein TonB|nr:energy transducer TonB [Gammaproteobacteria bacterium]MBT4605875.1 energy transducer TonB [Thiotrichales bacterium]MBT4081547.1 energy transducer TonB [Gammaproteobacteria bacterium]MBT4811842.1 energy transducer TonB [Thiotrichales bacterium]MBT6081286.1 energy transducer TonB [Gammaproteobacteria bacterium]